MKGGIKQLKEIDGEMRFKETQNVRDENSKPH